MNIKVNNTLNIDSQVKNKMLEKDESFHDVLKKIKSKSDETNKIELQEIYDKSTNIRVFGKILNIDMKKNKEKSLKENGKLNVMSILHQYGNDVSTRDLNELLKVINSLYKEGLIDEEDYFEALKWIREKIFQKSMEIKIDKEKFEVIESLDRNK